MLEIVFVCLFNICTVQVEFPALVLWGDQDPHLESTLADPPSKVTKVTVKHFPEVCFGDFMFRKIHVLVIAKLISFSTPCAQCRVRIGFNGMKQRV